MSDGKDYENMSSIEILNAFRNKYHAEGYSTESGIVANAINEFLPTLVKIDHICMIEYPKCIGPYTIQQAAVFDNRKISEELVRDLIIAGEEYHPAVVFMTKAQFESLFH